MEKSVFVSGATPYSDAERQRDQEERRQALAMAKRRRHYGRYSGTRALTVVEARRSSNRMVGSE